MIPEIFAIAVFITLLAGITTYILDSPKNTAVSFQSVQRIVTHVEGFELVESGVPLKAPYLFDVGSAIWANYPFFIYRGETYERAGAGGVVIRKPVSRNARYEVREEARDFDESDKRVLASNLSIIDRENGEVLGVRFLREGQIVGGTGWIGEHAAKFVRQVLVPDDPIGGGRGIKPYPQHPFQIERLAYDADKDKPQITGCPSTFFIDRPPWNRTLNTGGWRFLPQSPIDAATCSGNYIAILSGAYADQVFIDILTREGSFLIQSEIRTMASLDMLSIRADQLLIDAKQVSFNLFYATPKDISNPTYSPLRQSYKVRITLPAGWTENIPLPAHPSPVIPPWPDQSPP